MKEVVKFLEKNSKWIIRILVFVWIGLIVKLWWFGMNTICWSSGWLSFCIIPEFEYYWNNAWYIAVILFIISMYWIYLIKNIDNKIKKVKIAFLIFVLWTIWKSIFFVVSPDFKFYYTPVSNQYVDEQWRITDIDKYMELIFKYCFSTDDDYLNYKYSKEKMCSMEDKIRSNLGSVENFIKVFDYANEINNELLYRRTYWWMQYVWLENVIEKYKDVTFYWYILDRKWNNIDAIINIEKYNHNNDLTKIFKFIKDWLLEWKKIDFEDFYKEREYWENFEDRVDFKLKQIPEINTKIFYNNY